MTSPIEKEFLVLFVAPASVLDSWTKTDPEVRRTAEEKMRAEWGDWMREHAAMISSIKAAGKTTRVASDGLSAAETTTMLSSFIAADSYEAAAKALQNHPHLQIPQASIEISEVRPMGGL